MSRGEYYFSHSKNGVLDFNAFVLVLFLFSISKIFHVLVLFLIEQEREHALEQLTCSYIPDSNQSLRFDRQNSFVSTWIKTIGT